MIRCQSRGKGINSIGRHSRKSRESSGVSLLTAMLSVAVPQVLKRPTHSRALMAHGLTKQEAMWVTGWKELVLLFLTHCRNSPLQV